MYSLVFLSVRRFSSLSPPSLLYLFIFEPLEIPLFLPFISSPFFSSPPTHVSFSHSFFISLILILLIAFLSFSSFFPVVHFRPFSPFTHIYTVVGHG